MRKILTALVLTLILSISLATAITTYNDSLNFGRKFEEVIKRAENITITKKFNLEFPRRTSLNDTITISVTLDSKPVNRAEIYYDKVMVGYTDVEGKFNLTLSETGGHSITAKKKDKNRNYSESHSASKSITVLDKLL